MAKHKNPLRRSGDRLAFYKEPGVNSPKPGIVVPSNTTPHVGPVYRIWKLLLDYALVAPTILLIWPLLGFIAIVIKLDSPGPIIFRRRVMGSNGRHFDAFKFRTMVTNGDEILANYPTLQAELYRNQKLKNDPRVTTVGKMLRRFSLDELPQLFNILRREMTLVGPRILTRPELRYYGTHTGTVLSMMPGLTGLWQVNGRADNPFSERVRLDLFYIQNWSISLDLKILLCTIPAVIGGQGAY